MTCQRPEFPLNSFSQPPQLGGLRPTFNPLGFSHRRPLNSTRPLGISFAVVAYHMQWCDERPPACGVGFRGGLDPPSVSADRLAVSGLGEARIPPVCRPTGLPRQPGEARRGQERPGEARRGQERPGEARRGQEKPGEARRGQERPGEARRGQEKPGEARRGQEGPGEAKRDQGRPGRAKEGEVKVS